MSLQRLCGRLTRLESQRRPGVVAAVLQRVQQCASVELGAFLMDALTSVDRATALAIMDQLPDTALEALMGPDAVRLIETLSDAELAALAKGDPAATQQFQRALRSLQH
jgi:electron transfer flavoprotein alpha/beta subunit